MPPVRLRRLPIMSILLAVHVVARSGTRVLAGSEALKPLRPFGYRRPSVRGHNSPWKCIFYDLATSVCYHPILNHWEFRFEHCEKAVGRRVFWARNEPFRGNIRGPRLAAAPSMKFLFHAWQ
jgi:hypothetical protein